VSSTTMRQTHRKVFLETLSLAASMGSAVLFSTWIIMGWSVRDVSLLTSLAVVVLTAGLLWHRSIHPAAIGPPVADEEPDGSEDEDDDPQRWDWFTIGLFVVSLVGVVVLGIVVRFAFPVLVIILFAAAGSAGLGDVALATLGMLGVTFVTELAIVIPLCKRWNLSLDDERPARGESSP
jgi:hypothetical protein